MGAETVAIALGANLGDPAATLLQVRPLLEEAVRRWSPLFETAPVGGPADQPPYLNAALLVEGTPDASPSIATPGLLRRRLLALEARFGRLTRERWGPRRLDLDLLWCGALRESRAELELPPPRLAERTFVLAPLAAIDPFLPLPASAAVGPCSCAEALAALLPRRPEPPPRRLPPRPGWPE